jgi:vacuolar-type H+-ATPase subunit H
VSDARKKSTEIVNKSADDSVSNTQATLDEARSKASKAAEKVISEGSTAVDLIKSTAEKTQSKAVDHLLKTMSSL